MLLGHDPIAVPQLIRAIISDFLVHAPKSAQTSSVKHALDKLGQSLNYNVSVTDSERARTERDWLLDVVWWEPGRGVVLAANCHWGNAGQIAHGFQRLMAVKAPLKLMMFASRHAGAEREDVPLRTDIDAILQALSAYLLDFNQHIAGETYVLLEHVETDSAFRAYEFHVPADGKLEIKLPEASGMFRRVEVSAAAVA